MTPLECPTCATCDARIDALTRERDNLHRLVDLAGTAQIADVVTLVKERADARTARDSHYAAWQDAINRLDVTEQELAAARAEIARLRAEPVRAQAEAEVERLTSERARWDAGRRAGLEEAAQVCETFGYAISERMTQAIRLLA